MCHPCYAFILRTASNHENEKKNAACVKILYIFKSILASIGNAILVNNINNKYGLLTESCYFLISCMVFIFSK